MRLSLSTAVASYLTLATSLPCAGQDTAADLAARLTGMTAVSGYEQAMVDSLLRVLPGAMRDRAGNAVLILGSGAPVRLAACAIDEWGYVVGGIREDGWITLRRVGAGQPPLWDQMHEGHRITLWGRKGAVPAVMAVQSTHLARGRSSIPNTPFTSDDGFVDTGARTPAEVETLGIRLVDPIALAKRPHRYGTDRLAAPDAARRAGCAALLQAARSARPAPGTTVIAFTVESRIRHRGVATVANQHRPERTLLVEYLVPRNAGAPLGQVDQRTLETLYPGTAVESVAMGAVNQLADAIRAWLESTP